MTQDIDKIKQLSENKKVVFVYGKFNILHPGHLRLLKFAKENGDFLVVAVEKNGGKDILLDEEFRLEALSQSLLVDYAFILSGSVVKFIQELKPNIVVKGSEHEGKINPEKEIIDSYGGELVFSSGDIRFLSLQLLQNEIENAKISNIEKPIQYLKRHDIESDKLLKVLDNFKKLHILVIGDTIIDEYKSCEALGMSREDPTIVVSPISSDIFLGGAGIVAAHAAGLGAKVKFFTVLGTDNTGKIAEEKINEYQVSGKIYRDSTRPTTFKQRFRANGKTLLRVNHLKQHHISRELQNDILSQIKSEIAEIDLIVFSDFSYGCLPQRLINGIVNLGKDAKIPMVADSQSSSQTGDISKFHNMTLATPTEREARLGVNDFESGLVVLAEKLRKKSNIKNVFITLESEGILIHADRENLREDESWLTDQLSALNNAPKDVAGAGDSLLIASSMALVSGATVLESAYIGSLAAACQVGRVGNIPLNINEIREEIK